MPQVPANRLGFFITGTDTGVGKTLVAAALLRGLRERGLTVAGMKPVATGCIATAQGLRNEDALVLQREGSARYPYATVNPFAYEPAIAPHLAAEEAGRPVDVDEIWRCFEILSADNDVIVVEGAGGWRVPLAGRLTTGHLALRLGLPVVLVVALRLGCLNHALMSAETIIGSGAMLAGWVANGIDAAFERAADNIATLEAWLPAPRLGTIPWLVPPDVRAAAARLDTSVLC
jgi:dethiobiotin synthetase